MRKEFNEDKFLYDVSEESILKDWDSEDLTDHEFSEGYQKFRQELIQEVREHETNEVTGEVIPIRPAKKKRFFKTSVGIAAAFAAALVLSLGVYAVSGIFSVRSRERTDESIGELSYTIEAEEGMMVTPVKLVMDYIPEGYVEFEKSEDGSGKFHKEDNTGGLTIFFNDYSYDVNFPFISDIEETEINGVKADVLTRNGEIEYNHIILMFYEDLGQIVTIYGHKDLSVDELKKVAENLKLEAMGEPSYVPADNTGEKEKVSVVQGEVKPIKDEQIVVWGEPIEMMRGITFTVKDIELKDNMDGLDEEYLWYNENGYDQYLNEDGTFKDVELGYTTWENNEMVVKHEGMSQVRLAYITLDITNTSDEDAMDEFVWGRIGSIGDDGIYKFCGDFGEVLEGWWRANGSEPVYYDGADYLDGVYNTHIFASDFKAGETRTVHLAIPYVQKIEESAYLMLRSWIGHLEPVYVKLIP